jgi:hypothetical protein
MTKYDFIFRPNWYIPPKKGRSHVLRIIVNW